MKTQQPLAFENIKQTSKDQIYRSATRTKIATIWRTMVVMIPVGYPCSASSPLYAKGATMPPAAEQMKTTALVTVFLVLPPMLEDTRVSMVTYAERKKTD